MSKRRRSSRAKAAHSNVLGGIERNRLRNQRRLLRAEREHALPRDAKARPNLPRRLHSERRRLLHRDGLPEQPLTVVLRRLVTSRDRVLDALAELLIHSDQPIAAPRLLAVVVDEAPLIFLARRRGRRR